MVKGNYSRDEVLRMTPREIMFAVQPVQELDDRERADALMIAAVGANDPKEAGEQIKDLIG